MINTMTVVICTKSRILTQTRSTASRFGVITPTVLSTHFGEIVLITRECSLLLMHFQV